jgi:hypothetical protein
MIVRCCQHTPTETPIFAATDIADANSQSHIGIVAVNGTRSAIRVRRLGVDTQAASGTIASPAAIGDSPIHLITMINRGPNAPVSMFLNGKPIDDMVGTSVAGFDFVSKPLYLGRGRRTSSTITANATGFDLYALSIIDCNQTDPTLGLLLDGNKALQVAYGVMNYLTDVYVAPSQSQPYKLY